MGIESKGGTKVVEEEISKLNKVDIEFLMNSECGTRVALSIWAFVNRVLLAFLLEWPWKD